MKLHISFQHISTLKFVKPECISKYYINCCIQLSVYILQRNMSTYALSSHNTKYCRIQMQAGLDILPSNAVTWRPVYQGFTNAGSDPEPGRCRRTDGKKWRCSKEAMAEHKYCERHINRNRHRSRKPVENQTRKTAKDTPPTGSLSSPVSQGSSKKAKASNELKPGSDTYWTDRLNRLICTETELYSSYMNPNYFRVMD